MRKHLIHHLKYIVMIVGFACLIAACKPDAQTNDLRIRVTVDGKEYVYTAPERVTISQFLQQTNIHLGELDKVNPSDFTQLTDNMLITIIRVREEVVCNDEALPYETKYINNADLKPGETRIAQAGQNG